MANCLEDKFSPAADANYATDLRLHAVISYPLFYIEDRICYSVCCPGLFKGISGLIPWREKWQPTPVFLPRKFHGQRILEGYSQSTGLQRVRYDHEQAGRISKESESAN